jgi:hypothetical protein
VSPPLESPTDATARRFRVALSFSGDNRPFIEEVANALAAALGRSAVLYDGYLTSELARPDLDLYLGDLYRNNSELIVPFYSSGYATRRWTQLEWRQMRDILSNAERSRIMPFRFDDTPIEGVLSIDGYVKIETSTPAEVAALIQERLGMADAAKLSALAAALISTYTYDDLAADFRKHLGRQLQTVVPRQAPTEAFPKLVEWASKTIEWTRPLAGLMLEERPGDPRVASFGQKYPEYAARLTQQEREELRQALGAVVPSYGEVRQLFRAALAVEPNDLIENPPADTEPADVPLRFLLRRTDYFDQLEAFIQAALILLPGPVLEGKAGPLLEMVRQRRSAKPPLDNDPFEACDLGGKILINRRVLRDSLRRVTAEQAATRVVAVNGPSRSGKSHSLYYIEHIERLGKYEKVLVRLEKDEPPATFTPALLMESLIAYIGTDATRLPVKTEDMTTTRWVRVLADRLVGLVKPRSKILLLVLDGFAHPNLNPLTREFVQELIKRAASESKLRVALLDYTDDLLPPEASGRYETEPIGEITESDLRRFFVSFGRARRMDLTAEVVGAIATSILSAVQAEPTARNERIAQKVEIWTKELGGRR